MNTTSVLLSTALTIALSLPTFGQSTHDDKTKTDMRHHEMSGMMGRSTVDAKVGAVHMKVWLKTQKQYRKMMTGQFGQMMHGKEEGTMGGTEMKHGEMAMKGMDHGDMAMDNSMMGGTHDMILDVTDASHGKEIADASAKVVIVSPSMKSTSVDLKSMKGFFGGPLMLDEKGEYQCTVSVAVHGVTKTKRFHYRVN